MSLSTTIYNASKVKIELEKENNKDFLTITVHSEESVSKISINGHLTEIINSIEKDLRLCKSAT